LREARIELKVVQDALRAGSVPVWKHKVATKVQAIWKGYRVRKVSFTIVPYSSSRRHVTGEQVRIRM
jgi:hypothetical protein